MRLYAIGDVHGRLDLLEAMHRRIGEELVRDPGADWRMVHLGDYVDRGPQSRGVIERLIERRRADPRNLVLAGNHDLGFVEFLRSPDGDGLFARHGGRETARSYGVDIDFKDPVSVSRGWLALREAVPEAHKRFLRGLAFSSSFGDFFFCHAGIRPGVPLDRQSPDDLVWIRGVFHDHEALYDKVVVHGHTPVGLAELRPNRVNVDTGAWQSGMLSALAVVGTDKRILTVG